MPELTGVLASFGVVALAEMGDKTQLIALSLASRFRRPWIVMLGILIATTANHALASWAGAWVATALPARVLGWALGLGFIGFGVWTLFPDTADEPADRAGWGPLVTTAVVFFFAEMGDKTQLATVALGARFGTPVPVIAGTTLGMLLADVPAVFIGDKLSQRVPMRLVHGVAAALFALLGAATLLGAGSRLGF